MATKRVAINGWAVMADVILENGTEIKDIYIGYVVCDEIAIIKKSREMVDGEVWRKVNKKIQKSTPTYVSRVNLNYKDVEV